MVTEVTRCGELESEVCLPRNTIGRLGTNDNRVFRKHVTLRCLDAGNSNLRSVCLETPLVNQEPMKIEFSGNTLCWEVSMRETEMHRPNTWKPMVQREAMEIDLAGKFHPFRDWKNNWSLVLIGGIGRGLEGVDKGMATASQWSKGRQSLGIIFCEGRQHLKYHCTLEGIFHIRIECLSGERAQ
jgi:hypothetical protein